MPSPPLKPFENNQYKIVSNSKFSITDKVLHLSNSKSKRKMLVLATPQYRTLLVGIDLDYYEMYSDGCKVLCSWVVGKSKCCDLFYDEELELQNP